MTLVISLHSLALWHIEEFSDLGVLDAFGNICASPVRASRQNTWWFVYFTMYSSPHQVLCLYMCFFCVYMDMHMYLHGVHVHICMYTCEVPRVPCILVFEGLQWTGIYWVQWVGWLMSLGDPPVSTSRLLRLQAHSHTTFLSLFFFFVPFFFLLKHCNQVLLLIRQTFCQLCHLPNPVVVLLSVRLFVSLLIPDCLGSTSAFRLSNLSYYLAKMHPSFLPLGIQPQKMCCMLPFNVGTFGSRSLFVRAVFMMP